MRNTYDHVTGGLKSLSYSKAHIRSKSKKQVREWKIDQKYPFLTL